MELWRIVMVFMALVIAACSRSNQAELPLKPLSSAFRRTMFENLAEWRSHINNIPLPGQEMDGLRVLINKWRSPGFAGEASTV